jgi:hypothetical protein
MARHNDVAGSEARNQPPGDGCHVVIEASVQHSKNRVIDQGCVTVLQKIC